MHYIRYAGEDLLVTDEVAVALMNYVLTLSRMGRSDVVSVPTLSTTGSTQTVSIHLHPTVDISSRRVEEPESELHPAPDFVAEMLLRSAGVDGGNEVTGG
ncbi:hypothetical protein [Naasia lichenicola]|uniref:Uncharacterized protein n=1 Tax=Naasia lichenicola TaxID=2565933 RepID=A0A4S4FRH7_9MICO|nr:hypothetical protein [Naasia lichenicola]THG33249.1 hypothetical protein E6C64_02545 [Naasia lichenicola]